MVSVGSSFYTGTRLHSGRLPRGAKRTIFLKTETIEFLDGTGYGPYSIGYVTVRSIRQV